MKHPAMLILGVIALSAATGHAQQPYAGLQTRAIKSLSEEQIADLRNGRGMGLALAAELNGYPGPIHVLELADQLSLTQEQRSRVEGLFKAMKAETIPLGEKLIRLEADLDHQFASGAVILPNLEQATDAIGMTQGSLRAAHLKYHLLTITELKPAQVQRYKELRGYKDAAPAAPHRGHH